MPIIAKTSQSKDRVIIPAGNHVARCYKMIELGTLTDEYKGESITRHRVSLSWELPNETHTFSEEQGPQPLSMNKEYTLSMHERATLRQHLESWRGKQFTKQEAEAFDITKLLGVPCMLNIVHSQSQNGNTYAQLTSITPLAKGMIAPDQINESFEFSLSEFDQDKFDQLPEFLKDKIDRSKERLEATTKNVQPEDVEGSEDLLF